MEEGIPEVSVKRFSRDKRIVKEEVEPTEPKKRGRKKKVVLQQEELPQEELPQGELVQELTQEEPIEAQESPKEDLFSDLKNWEEEKKEEPPVEKEETFHRQPSFPSFPIGEPLIGTPPPRAKGKKKVRFASGDFNDILASRDEPVTQILGKEKRELLTRLHQFKVMFPEELKGLKIPENASAEKLQSYIDEAECIVSTKSLGDFLDQSLLNTIRVVEVVSSRTHNFNITGSADMLSQNPDFRKLTKLLWIKYKTFSQVPPELQLMLVISTTCAYNMKKNRALSGLQATLDSPVV